MRCTRLPLAIVTPLGAALVAVCSLYAQQPHAATPDGETRVDFAAGGGEIVAWLRTGKPPGAVNVALHWDDATVTPLRLHSANAAGDPLAAPEPGGGATNIALDDALIECPQLQLKLWVRPNPDGYPAARRRELLERWNRLPGAARYLFPLSIRPDAAGVQYWVDGRYVCRTDRQAALRSVIFEPVNGGEVSAAGQVAAPMDERFLTLDLTRMPRPAAMAGVTLSLPAGRQSVGGIPFVVGRGDECVALSPGCDMTTATAEGDTSPPRGAFDGGPESPLYSVPLAQYIRAWVLCAAAGGGDSERLLTARLTRCTADGRGDARADTTVRLPRAGTPAPGFTRVGTVIFDGDQDRHKAPLWLAEVPIAIGAIQDLIFFPHDEPYNAGLLADRRYLDCELLGRPGRFQTGAGGLRAPDSAATNGVHVFGLTLERTPVEMELRSVRTGNIFQGDEQPALDVRLRPRHGYGHHKLSWQLHAVDGRRLDEGAYTLNLTAGDERKTIVSLDPPGAGWYGVDVTLADATGRRLLECSSALALLPADTRNAGRASPYGAWWFGAAHRGTDAGDSAGPLLQRAGLRHTNFGWHRLTEADMAPWQVGSFAVPWLWRSTGNPAADALRYEEGVRNYLARFPGTTMALVGHEALGACGAAAAAAASEPEPGAAAQAASNATAVLRASFPRLQRVCGDARLGVQAATGLLRHGFPPPDMDGLRLAVGAHSHLPERARFDDMLIAWELRALASRAGHELAPTSAGEWVCRQERVLGEQRQAEWSVRDALTAHAYGFRRISLGLLYDAGDNSYHTPLGGSGLCRRYPLLYPKPAYVACATMTRLLDNLQLARRVPTGSLTLYALEFAGRGRFVYALWTPRGTCAAQLRFDGRIAARVTDLYGATREIASRRGRLDVEVNTTPQYLACDRPVSAIVAGARGFPLDQPPAQRHVIDAMRSPAAWRLAEVRTDQASAASPAPFSLTSLRDSAQGACLELALPRDAFAGGAAERLLAALTLADPRPLPGRPANLGVWVKGNSGWGRVDWLFRDADGQDFVVAGGGDWPRDHNIDFDGWCFMACDIADARPARAAAADGADDGVSARAPRHPITPTGLLVEMPRRAPDLMAPVEVEQRIRLRELCAY